MELGSIFLLLAVILLVGIYVSRPLFQRSDPANKVENSPDQAGDEAVYSARSGAEPDHIRSSLLAEYDRLLNTIQELEFDHTLGKIPPEDYPAQRAALLQAGADVLKKLDVIRAAPAVKDLDVVIPQKGSAAARFASAAQMKLAQDGTGVDRAKANPATAGDHPEPDGAGLEPAVFGAGSADVLSSLGASGLTSTMDNAGAATSETDLDLLIATRRQVRSEKTSGFCPRCGKPVQKSDRFCPKCGKTL
ncbi:MAG TPA: zinc ribbon domain-containing protein [Anaerolineaceae bacterium]|jgi:zinc-ribbon domain